MSNPYAASLSAAPDLAQQRKRAKPLHFAAAWSGQFEAAKLLVVRGADPTIREGNYNARPSGWANHFGHGEIEAFLLEAEKARER